MALFRKEEVKRCESCGKKIQYGTMCVKCIAKLGKGKPGRSPWS